MDHEDARLFQPIKVGLSTAEKGDERFKTSYIHPRPETHHWRNNLTALSQRYNFYFVATGAHVAVYVPSFPFQKIGSRPVLSLPPILANTAAKGYIDPESPHTINHLVIGDLGDVEILLLCTDSGNVTAYQTRSIHDAVQEQSLKSNSTLSERCIEVRAFFSQWVFESAWGLAIHRHARMIAVSANTPYHEPSTDVSAKITVFAFALSSKGSYEENDIGDNIETGENHNGWHLWEADPYKPALPDRRLNYRIILGGPDGHAHNIPNISFIQSSHQQLGHWLLSTDIGGEMKAWRIWPGHCYKTWDFSDQQTGGIVPWRDRRRQSGWNVVTLDPMSFRTMGTMEEFCGWKKAPQYYGYWGPGASYDITNIVRQMVPSSSTLHPALRFGADDESANSEEAEDFSKDMFEALLDAEESDIGEDGHVLEFDIYVAPVSPLNSDDVQTTQQPETTNPTPALLGGRDTSAATSDFDDSQMSPNFDVSLDEELQSHDESDQPSENMQNESEEIDSDSESSVPASSEPDPLANEHDSRDDSLQQRLHSDTASFISSTESRAPANLSRRQSWMRSALRKSYSRRAELRNTQLYGLPPQIPVIHCTASHMRLLADPSVDTPHLFCAQILKQQLPTIIENSHHSHLDRLNMIQTIPELGVVLIATQIGRCAVCTLTRNGKDGEYGLRVDWILPTAAEENRGLRPIQDLLGIAVGPIQGRMVRNQPKKSGTQPEKLALQQLRQLVPASFEPTPVILSDCTNTLNPPVTPDQETTTHSNDSSPGSQRPKRKRSHSDASTGSASAAPRSPTRKTEKCAWPPPQSLPPWAGTENSRRYRLMLTYTDQTVLTYELSREFEVVELGVGEDGGLRRNFRNWSAF